MKTPKEILVYVCDYEDGKPVFAVALNVNELPADSDGEKVGSYTLNRISTFTVKRELK